MDFQELIHLASGANAPVAALPLGAGTPPGIGGRILTCGAPAGPGTIAGRVPFGDGWGGIPRDLAGTATTTHLSTAIKHLQP